MEIQNKIGEQVFDKLRSKFSQITLGDAEGNSTQDPTEAVFFNFNYVDNQGHDHGNITISLIDRTMKIYYSKNISKDLEGSELTEWYVFLKDMRKTAMSSLYGFDTHDISKSALDIADIQSTVNRNNMKESKMYGSKKRSYQDHGPAKIIVRHTENIDPEIRGARSRKLESVFVETFEGERFKMPFNSLPGTRAMAQHIGQGGRPYDEIGESITTMVNEIASLRPFISRNRNAIYEDETTMQMVEAAREYYAEARKTLGKIKGKRGYKAYVENFEVTEEFEFIDEEAIAMRERFTKKRFSDKMETAMPIVQKAFNLKRPKTPGIKPITEFEEWADEITEMPHEPDNLQIEMNLNEHEMEIIKGIIAGTVEMDDYPDFIEKLFDHYLNSGEMPYGVAKARTGDPYQWIADKLDQEFGHLVEAKEEMCSTECCGHKISDCHCGPDCPHCDCYEKKKLGEDDNFEDHKNMQYHNDAKRYEKAADKERKVNEGTWSIPDTPEKQAELKQLMQSPLPAGVGGENATNALYHLLGDDGLFDELFTIADKDGPENDTRPVILHFLQQILNDVDSERGEDTPDWGDLRSLGNGIGGILGPDRGMAGFTEVVEDVVLPKATYSDYLEVYKSSAIGGTDTDDDAKRMIKSLKKKGKDGDEKAAKGALKRMAEQEAKSGLHLTESIKKLQREAGIIK